MSLYVFKVDDSFASNQNGIWDAVHDKGNPWHAWKRITQLIESGHLEANKLLVSFHDVLASETERWFVKNGDRCVIYTNPVACFQIQTHGEFAPAITPGSSSMVSTKNINNVSTGSIKVPRTASLLVVCFESSHQPDDPSN